MNNPGMTELRSETRMDTGLKFKPKILGFVCHW